MLPLAASVSGRQAGVSLVVFPGEHRLTVVIPAANWFGIVVPCSCCSHGVRVVR